jgi:hypothetical protein
MALGWRWPAFDCSRVAVGIGHLVTEPTLSCGAASLMKWTNDFLGGLKPASGREGKDPLRQRLVFEDVTDSVWVTPSFTRDRVRRTLTSEVSSIETVN